MLSFHIAYFFDKYTGPDGSCRPRTEAEQIRISFFGNLTESKYYFIYLFNIGYFNSVKKDKLRNETDK